MMYLIPTQALNAQWLALPSPPLSPAIGWSTYTERNNGPSPPAPGQVHDVFAMFSHFSQPAPYCYKGCLRCDPEWKRARCRPPTHQTVGRRMKTNKHSWVWVKQSVFSALAYLNMKIRNLKNTTSELLSSHIAPVGKGVAVVFVYKHDFKF